MANKLTEFVEKHYRGTATDANGSWLIIECGKPDLESLLRGLLGEIEEKAQYPRIGSVGVVSETDIRSVFSNYIALDNNGLAKD